MKRHASPVRAADTVTLLPEGTLLHQIPPENVEIKGELLERLARAANRLLHDPPYSEEYILHSVNLAPGTLSHFGDWSGDMSGRWTYALASARRLTAEPYPELLAIAEKMRACQRDDGHFGKEQPLSTTDRAQIYGNGWVLLALTEITLATGDERFLDAARRLGDYYVAVQDSWFDPAERARPDESYAQDFSNFLHALDGLVLLHRATRGPQYLALARRMAENLLPYSDADHSHNFLSTRRGLLDLFGITGDARYLRQAEEDWAVVSSKAMIPTGGIFERFKDPRRDEGCSVADWLRFNLQLWQCTGNGRYLDLAERTLVNHLFYNQIENGGFSHNFVAPLLSRDPQESVWCCSMHGTHALSVLPRFLVMHGESEICVGLYAPCRVTVPWSEPVTLAMDTDSLPASRVKLTISTRSSRSFALKLRVPQGATLRQLTVDGKLLQKRVSEGFITLQRAWGGRTVVEMELSFVVWVEVGGTPVPASSITPGAAWPEASLLYGPLLLTHNMEDIMATPLALLLPAERDGRFAANLASPLRQASPRPGPGPGCPGPLFKVLGAELWGKTGSVDAIRSAAAIGPKRLCPMYRASERQGRFYRSPVVITDAR